MKLKLQKMVDDVLRNMPETRNSDVRLLIEIWKRYYPQRVRVGQGGEEGVYLKDLYDLPREDAVKRYRAMLNAKGMYYPTDWKVAKARGIQEDQWRKVLGYPVKEQTKNPTKADSYMDQEREFERNQGVLL